MSVPNQTLKAMDTETTSDGKARIIADESHYRSVRSFADIIDFFENGKKKAVIYETWNLGFDSRAIIKWTDPEIWEALYNAEPVEYEGVKLRMFGGKKFSIGYPYGKDQTRYRYVHVYDMASFYGYQKLDTAAKQYNPISPASLAGKLMQEKNKDDYPMSDSFTTEPFTHATYRGGFFSCMKRGKFDQPIYEYDISSAYPAVQSTLPHVRRDGL